MRSCVVRESLKENRFLLDTLMKRRIHGGSDLCGVAVFVEFSLTKVIRDAVFRSQAPRPQGGGRILKNRVIQLSERAKTTRNPRACSRTS